MDFLKIFSFQDLKENFKNTINRFPISIWITVVITIIFFILLHSESQNQIWWERLIKTNISLIMAFVLSIWIYLAWENTNLSKLKQNSFQILTLIFAWIFYYNFSSNIDDFKNFLNFFLNFSWILAFLFFAFYINNLIKKQIPKTNIFYSYFYNISVTIFISLIFAWILFVLWMIAILATDALFNLHINWQNTYWNWSIISLSFISPFFLLTQIPKKEIFMQDSYKENKFFSFLIKYLAIPFIYIYFAILYAYSIKVLSNFWNWPKWIISWLVIWFSIFGYLTYSFSLTFEKENKTIKFFRKIFPYAVIPQTIMLFYAIYLRINQYDFTINRYFIVIFWIWLILISLHFIFSKNKNLIAIPVSLFIIIILISITPKYNIYTFPIERQYERLKNDLKKAKILQNSKIIPLKNYSDISQNLSKNIYSEINYLCDFNNCKKIKKLFPIIYNNIFQKDKTKWEKNIQNQIKEILKNKDKKECDYEKYYRYNQENCFNKKYLKELQNKKYNWPNRWEIVREITEKIKVKNYFWWYFWNNIPEINIYWSYDILFPLEIDWYKKVFRIWTNRYSDKKSKIYWQVNITQKNIEIIENWEIKETLDIKNIFEEIKKRYNKKDSSKDWRQEDLTFIVNNKYKIIFQTIRIPSNFKDIKKEDDFSYYDMNWVILER